MAITGLGMSSMFATGLLWCQKYIVVSNRIGAAFSLSGMAMADLLPALIGELIEQCPMSMIYVNFSVTLGCILLLISAACIGNRMVSAKWYVPKC